MLISQTLRRTPVGSIATILLATTSVLAATPTQQPAKSADEMFLDGLQGSWIMSGTIGGKPAQYLADGRRVLEGGFLRLHMIDAQKPPQYEAEVFIGFDAKANDYIAHWLDRFGAAGARVVARGERKGEQLVIIFPYTDGAFRDTFLWKPASRSWSLLLESQSAGGAWATFATYTLTPRSHR
jgi:hypothetical protein